MWNPVLNMEYYIDVKKSREISDSLKRSCVDKCLQEVQYKDKEIK